MAQGNFIENLRIQKKGNLINESQFCRLLDNHAEIVVEVDKVILRPLGGDGEGRVLVNGLPIQSDTELRPNDRLVFGSTQLWLFRHPQLEKNAGVSDSPMINYDFFMNEMAAKSGLDVLSSQVAAADGSASLQDELLSLLPFVEVLIREKQF